MTDISTMWREAPMISRSLASVSLLMSFGAWSLNLVEPMKLVYVPQAVFNYKRPELWRLATSLLLTHPGLSILLTPFFLFRYSSDCEREKFMRPGDFFTFVTFISTTIIVLNTFIFGGFMLLQPLVFAFAYYWTAWQPANNRVNFFVATFPVKVLPPLMLLVTFVQAGLHETLVELSGGIAAHLYLFATEIYPNYGSGTGRSWVWTPGWVHALFERPASRPRAPTVVVPKVKERSGSVVNVGSAGTGTSTQDGGSASGSSLFGKKPDGWSHRGAGHKLGS